MGKPDLDTIHLGRTKKLANRSSFDPEDLFISERALKAIESEKIFLQSYDQDEIMAMLPFSQNLFVRICKYCISKDRFENFKKLVESGSIIPVLTAPYNKFPQSVADLVSSHDHISTYEFHLYRHRMITSGSAKWVCSHCVAEANKGALSHVRSKENFSDFERLVGQISSNLNPLIEPDSELIAAVNSACKAGSIERLRQILRISFGVQEVRTAQVFDAPIMLRADRFGESPAGLWDQADEAHRIGLDMKNYAVDGLGLQIPTDIDIQDYIELVSDYRPIIAGILNDVARNSLDPDGFISMPDLQRQVIAINSEIERIKGLRRSIVLDACLSYYQQHPMLVNTGLVMCAFGFAGSLLGCAATGGTQAVRGVIKKVVNEKAKKSSPAEGKSVPRLRDVVRRDLQPIMNKLIETYVGSSAPAVSVLSLRRTVDRRVREARSKTILEPRSVAGRVKGTKVGK